MISGCGRRDVTDVVSTPVCPESCSEGVVLLFKPLLRTAKVDKDVTKSFVLMISCFLTSSSLSSSVFRFLPNAAKRSSKIIESCGHCLLNNVVNILKPVITLPPMMARSSSKEIGCVSGDGGGGGGGDGGGGDGANRILDSMVISGTAANKA